MQGNFQRAFLFMLAGPIIWAIHFLFIYALHGLACARPMLLGVWLGRPASAWIIVVAGAFAIIAMAWIYLQWRHSMPDMGRPAFIPRLAAALSLLSALAIIWETIPLLWLPACGQ
ncbi:hypothetical protein H0A65_01455 [Alcaligenaceae bacterium]|nr:hypothetical protein [Alcaligenaceae bacterium]